MPEDLAVIEESIPLDHRQEAYELLGKGDNLLKILREGLGCRFAVRGEELLITGSAHQVKSAVSAVSALLSLLRRGTSLTEQEVRYAIRLVQAGEEKSLRRLFEDVLLTAHGGKPVRVQTLGQREYVDTIRHNDITLAEGAAGSGKTFLAVAMAVLALRAHEVNRIVLTRPAVEAGERLGFLPGDFSDKVDPYLRPLYDTLSELMGHDVYRKLLAKGIIEIAPLAYMRGRTLSNAFIILDEGQNTTVRQMKMFLTRLGCGSKMVVTGDCAQADLPRGVRSGLADALTVLRGIRGVGIARLTEEDIVRHDVVSRIVAAYDRAEKNSTREQCFGQT